jgi:hypothetical protein
VDLLEQVDVLVQVFRLRQEPDALVRAVEGKELTLRKGGDDWKVMRGKAQGLGALSEQLAVGGPPALLDPVDLVVGQALDRLLDGGSVGELDVDLVSDDVDDRALLDGKKNGLGHV